MRGRLFTLLALGAIFLGTSTWGMPLHPDLVERIERGEVPPPWPPESELRARGINNPSLWPELQGNWNPPKAQWRQLLILVDFTDHVRQVSPAKFDTLIYDTTYYRLNNYFKAISYGNLDIVTVHLPSAIGWVRAPQTYAYYVNGQRGFGTYPQNAQRLTEDAVYKADTAGVDFSRYDNNGDGTVDGIFIVHSGPGYEYSGNVNDIHSHAWSTRNPPLVDGVRVRGYSMEPEYWQTPGDMTIGVYAHELGHAAFGLPDLYDYDYDSYGVGRWSLMAYGSWNGTRGNSPSFPEAYCHIRMGFVTPTILTQNILNQSIRAVEDSGRVFRLWTNGTQGNQYFLVENRQRKSYDTGLPAAGLHIYHVDQGVTTGNDRQWYPGYTANGHYLVAMEQADGLWEMEKYTSSGNAGDVWSAATHTTLDSATVPDSKDYAFLGTKVMVRNVSASGNAMTADLYVRDLIGVEEGAVSLFVPRRSFSVSPNPFTFFARVTGCEQGSFALFDVSGRRMGIFPGDRIGEGLIPGIYFLQAVGGDSKPLRIMKVR